MDDRGGWKLEDAASAGAIGGHAGTHMSQGLAPGDTIGGTVEVAHDPTLAEGTTASETTGGDEPGAPPQPPTREPGATPVPARPA